MKEKRKVVLITGGTRGLGRECSLLFAKNGYDIVINYYTSDNAANSLKEEIIRQYDVNVLLIKCDISCEDDVKNMVSKIISYFGYIDVLVNNAAISKDTYLFDKTIDDFKRVIDVNLIGTFLVSKYVGNCMLDKQNGVIINISSNNAINANYPESVDYDASKAGVISLTHNFAMALKPFVRVNAVCPGWMDTDMNKDMSPDYKKQEEDKIYLGRFGAAKEIANVVLFLASSQASYVNNSIIRIDGGTNG